MLVFFRTEGLVFLFTAALAISAAAKQPAIDSALGARVLAFARAHLGQLVGDGECADLADQALAASGARSFSAYMAVTRGDDYVWGRRVSLSDARPGDIVQFRDYVAAVSTRTPDGESGSEQYRPHHTAILEANLGDALIVLEQNGEPDRAVQRTKVPVRTKVFRGAADGAPDPAAVTSVEVSGMISIYRPESGGDV